MQTAYLDSQGVEHITLPCCINLATNKSIMNCTEKPSTILFLTFHFICRYSLHQAIANRLIVVYRWDWETVL